MRGSEDHMLFLLKLALVASVILAATAAARRWGHTASGLLAGLPMIIGPITAILLIDQGAERVHAILLATLQCQPAMLLHVLAFAHAAARRVGAAACLLLANGVYLAGAIGLTQLGLGAVGAIALVITAWAVALRAMPPSGTLRLGRVDVPQAELWWRVLIAMAVAAGVILGAGTLPAAFGGVLLAAPITGNVLPAFTLPRHGPAATVQLMRGFIHGQLGFGAFVATMVMLLPLAPRVPAGLAWAASVAVAMCAPWVHARLRSR